LVKRLKPEPLVQHRVRKKIDYDVPTYYEVQSGKRLSKNPPPIVKVTTSRSESPQGALFDWA
jgi:hypothetical protein